MKKRKLLHKGFSRHEIWSGEDKHGHYIVVKIYSDDPIDKFMRDEGERNKKENGS